MSNLAPGAAPPGPRARLAPQAGPATWRAAELRTSDWMIPLGAEDAAELDLALGALGGRPPASAEEVKLPRLGAVLREAATRLDTGQGFALLRGLKLGEAETPAESVLLALAAHLGRAVPAGAGGEVVSRLASPASGVARWRFHADAADIVALLILRQPPDVDPVMLVAAATVHNELLKRNRAALEVLHRPLPHAVPAAPGGEARMAELPVFSTASGAFTGRYAREAIEAAQRLPETPRLTAAQVEALDLLDAVCAEPGLALRLDVRPGDVLLFNPLQVWKRRAESVESLAGEATRDALRVMLLTPTSRALPEGLAALGVGAATETGGGMVGG